MRTAAPRNDERGLALVEVMIAIAIFTTVLIALGGLMYQISNQTRTSASATYRAAALQSAETWIQGLPWDSIPVYATGCAAKTVGAFAYNLCLSYSSPTAKTREMTIIVVPTGSFVTRPETLRVDRARPAGSVSTLNLH